MRRRRLFVLASVCIAIAALATPRLARAATFDVDLQRDSCQLRLSGPIERDDLARLKAKLGADFDPHMKAGPEICLNSEGGDFIEGVHIAEYVANGISTRIEKGAGCASACSWIFLAGLSSATKLSEWSRTMDAHSKLVFHAPFIPPESFTSGPGSGPVPFVEVVKAYNQAVAEIGTNLLKLAQKFDSPPTSPLVPPTLLAQALVMLGGEKLVVSTTGDVVRWHIKVDGYAGVVPRSKQDVARACLLASWQANQWPADFLSDPATRFTDPASPEFDDYLGYYDPGEHKLTAQVILNGHASIACELQFYFNDKLNDLERPIEGTANLGWDRSLAFVALDGGGTPTPVTLPAFSVLPQDTRLESLPAQAKGPVDIKALVTIGASDWCRTQQVKKRDEKAVCQNGSVSALDAILNRFYRDALAGNSKAEAQADQRTWLPRRQLCADDADCLEQAQIAKMRGYVQPK